MIIGARRDFSDTFQDKSMYFEKAYHGVRCRMGSVTCATPVLCQYGIARYVLSDPDIGDLDFRCKVCSLFVH